MFDCVVFIRRLILHLLGSGFDCYIQFEGAHYRFSPTMGYY